MTVLAHTWYMTVREIRALLRQPWWIAISLAQPIIWLLLFGALFKRIVELPGFESTSYITFLTPGIIIMSAMFSGGWSGMGFLQDMDRGVVDRFLVTPVRRTPIMVGPLLQQALVSAVQSVILVILALILGAQYPGGPLGILLLIVCAALLSIAFGSLANALALLVRREETLIAAVNFILLPLTFLSSAFLQLDLAPGWIQTAARFNPTDWTIQVGRTALSADTDWSLVLSRGSMLLAFAVVATGLSLRAIRVYQKSI
jgi:ABC-2 type transport system permease protein